MSKEYYPNFKLSSSTTEKTMGGNPAYSLEGTYTDVIYGQQKVMKIGTIKNCIVSYIIYFGSSSVFEKYLPTAEDIILTLEIGVVVNPFSQS